jgi:Protein of unknown function (DUF4031)
VIIVDEIQKWPTSIRCFKAGSSHLTTDDIGEAGVVELHAFAAKIGLARAWYQGEKASWPHYDLTIGKREAALRAGAVFISAREQVPARAAARNRGDVIAWRRREGWLP